MFSRVFRTYQYRDLPLLPPGSSPRDTTRISRTICSALSRILHSSASTAVFIPFRKLFRAVSSSPSSLLNMTAQS